MNFHFHARLATDGGRRVASCNTLSSELGRDPSGTGVSKLFSGWFGSVHVVGRLKVGFPDYSAYSLPLIVVSVAEIERRWRDGGTHKLDLGVGEDVDNGSGSDESLVPLKAAGKLDNRRERVMEHLFIFFRTELGP